MHATLITDQRNRKKQQLKARAIQKVYLQKKKKVERNVWKAGRRLHWPKQKTRKRQKEPTGLGKLNNKRAGRKKESSDSPEIPEKGGGVTSEELGLPSSQKND